MKTFPKKNLFAIAFIILAGHSLAANDTTIFSDSSGFKPGWSVKAWRVKASETQSFGKKSMEMKYVGRKPWGGARFRADDNASEMPVSKTDLETKNLIFYVNGGNDATGRHLGNQTIQAQLEFSLSDNSSYSKKYAQCASFTEDETIDNDPDTWQMVSMPLKLFAGKGKKKTDIKSIKACNIQFYGNDLPKNPMHITNIRIGKATRKKGRKKIAFGPPLKDVVFPEFNQIPKCLKVKPDYKVEIKGPNYIVEGKPRFLAGAEISRQAKVGVEYKTTPGYDKKYNWIYEKLPDFESAQRLGFDTMGCFIPSGWMKKYDPNIKAESPGTQKRFERFMREIKMPLYIDFTLFPWGSGKLVDTDKIPQRAKSNPKLKQHWLGYDPDNEDGLRLLKDYWKFGAELVVKNKIDPLFYELFNEPTYFCDCKDNRILFVKWLKKKHGSERAMNQKWSSNYESFEDAARFKNSSDNQGLYVDYSQFLEDRWIDILKIGIATIKSVDKRKNIQITCQAAGPYTIDPHLASLNYYKMNALFSTIQAPTGCGGLSHTRNVGAKKAPKNTIDAPMQNQGAIKSSMTMKILRGISPDKPIVNGESGFPPPSRKGLCDRFWIEMMRGVNASYLFVWTRRAWDINPSNSIEAAMAKAKQYPYLMLNPYAIPTSALPGIMDFKKEMIALQDIMAEQPRGIKPEVALLHSFASRRFSYVSKEDSTADEIINYYAALEYSYYPFDALLEEQIRDGEKHKKYKVIIAGGVESTLPTVRKKLEDFVKDGGILVLGLNTLSNDEYNNKTDSTEWAGVKLSRTKSKPISLKFSIPQTSALPDTIRGLSYAKITPKDSYVIATAGSAPIITEKKLGKGKIYYIGGIFREGHLVAILSTILEREKIKKPVALTGQDKRLLPNIESILVDRGDTKAIFLWNWDLYTKIGKLNLNDYFMMDSAYIFDPLEKISFLTQEGKKQWTPEDAKRGNIYLKLPPHGKAIIVISKKPWVKYDLKKCKPEELLKRLSEEIKELARKDSDREKAAGEEEKLRAFKVNPEDCFTVDIRKFCNRSFMDRVARDGLDGWTDQGRKKSLTELAAGRHVWLNVPFDIIRYDQNSDTSCIFFKSQSTNFGRSAAEIPFMKKAKRLFFLHTAAWTKPGKPGEILKYTINYADGTKKDFVAKCDKNFKKSQIGDWWNPKMDFNENAKVAWTNSKGHGLYICQWRNPNPEKLIKSINISSFNNVAVPIVVGISAEKAE